MRREGKDKRGEEERWERLKTRKGEKGKINEEKGKIREAKKSRKYQIKVRNEEKRKK